VSAFARLISQLSSSSVPPTEVEIKEIISSPSTVLFVAKDNSRNGEIVGALVLVLFRILTGVRAWIEDVVVDYEYRRKGIGEKLNQTALRRAARAGARTVDLTSRPSRESANRLYRRMGFNKRETNIYRYEFE
jgi:ribosomal protein S18 acetylase RimI-like enzyme